MGTIREVHPARLAWGIIGNQVCDQKEHRNGVFSRSKIASSKGFKKSGHLADENRSCLKRLHLLRIDNCLGIAVVGKLMT